jgi:glycolate oxidase FAD binding subunit
MSTSESSPVASIVTVKNLDEVRQAIETLESVNVRAGGTKSALSSHANLCTASLSGILQYEPSEYTFTALAGTKLSEVRDMLAEHGQILPFDPPMVDSGATLGGTVAAGVSGSGRFRYGGVRDFLLGVQLVTLKNRVVFGGGKVVKNAAGFDIPKLMVGSRGKFGVMTELTFKVFPRPDVFSTLLLKHSTLDGAVNCMTDLARQPLDLICLDLIPSANTVAIRIGGMSTSIAQRVTRIREAVGVNTDELSGEDEIRYWSRVNEFKWLHSNDRLLKIPIAPSQLPHAERILSGFDEPISRRYSVGGNVLWLGWPYGESTVKLEGMCLQLTANALPLTGSWSDEVIGVPHGSEFEKRLLASFA